MAPWGPSTDSQRRGPGVTASGLPSTITPAGLLLLAYLMPEAARL